MKDLSKAIATVAVWSGTALLAHLFNSYGILTGGGAGWMVFGAIMVTAGLWRF